MWFDQDGRLSRVDVRGAYWGMVAKPRVVADRWIPTSEAELRSFEVADTIRVDRLDESPSILASADQWLSPARTLASHGNLDLIGRLSEGSDLDALRLLPITGNDEPVGLRNRELVALGLNFMRQRSRRSVSFSRLTFTTLSQVEPIESKHLNASQLVVFRRRRARSLGS